jgi:membrane protein YqaA with SNARE-associated domain
VVTPFLPKFLVLRSAFASRTLSNIGWVFVVLSVAAILGDSANYAIGKYFGSIILKKQGTRFLKKEHIERTHRFYEKYGSKTIVLARFVPIVRTFAPFVAGVGRMSYPHFLTYNVVGGLLWITPLRSAVLRREYPDGQKLDRHYRDYHHLDPPGGDRNLEGKGTTSAGGGARRQRAAKRFLKSLIRMNEAQRHILLWDRRDTVKAVVTGVPLPKPQSESGPDGLLRVLCR